jgi:Spy/CpxP family protein refolding chaperone
MKKLMMMMLVVLAALTATAQDKKEQNFGEKLFEAKVNELAYRLEMTEQQKAKFIPIYRRYNDEMRSIMGKHKKPEKPLTEEEKLARTKNKMERQQQAQAIRLKYLDEFTTVLTPQQVNRFYEGEGKIQKKLMDRKQHPMHPNLKKGKSIHMKDKMKFRNHTDFS